MREAAAEERDARRACAGWGCAARAWEVARAVERPKLRGRGREEREERSERSVASAEESEADALAGEEGVCSSMVWTWVRRPARVAREDRTVFCIVRRDGVGTADNPVGSASGLGLVVDEVDEVVEVEEVEVVEVEVVEGGGGRGEFGKVGDWVKGGVVRRGGGRVIRFIVLTLTRR